MTGHPFQDPHDVRVLYADSARQKGRVAALKAAKCSGENPGDVLAGLAARFGSSTPRVLEVGCGAGGALTRIASVLDPKSLTAFDRSPAMLARARERVGEKLEIAEGDFHALPFTDETFDVGMAAFCLYHSPTPSLVCAELGRCVTSEGLVLLATKSSDSYRELDLLVGAAGLDENAPSARSLYESFHSANLAEIAGSVLDLIEVVHEPHSFRFATPSHAAEYVVTTPKYRACSDVHAVAAALASAWPAGGFKMTSTVSYAVASPRSAR